MTRFAALVRNPQRTLGFTFPGTSMWPLLPFLMQPMNVAALLGRTTSCSMVVADHLSLLASIAVDGSPLGGKGKGRTVSSKEVDAKNDDGENVLWELERGSERRVYYKINKRSSDSVELSYTGIDIQTRSISRKKCN